jgi:hypothetical protein
MKAVIDRMEGTIAVLIFPDEDQIRLNMPVALLPPGCEEGDIIDIVITRDDEATAEARRRVTTLLHNLVHREVS